MKTTSLVFILFMLFFFCCKQENRESTNNDFKKNTKLISIKDSILYQKDKTLKIEEIENKFLYQQKIYNFDTILLQYIWNNFENNSLKGEVLNKLMQRGDYSFDETKEYSYILVSLQDTMLYYSLTIFYEKWGWLSSVYLRTYDKNWVFINDIELVASGNDAEIQYLSQSIFINDSILKKKTIKINNDDFNNHFSTDTIIKYYLIHKNGRIVENNFYKQ